MVETTRLTPEEVIAEEIPSEAAVK